MTSSTQLTVPNFSTPTLTFVMACAGDWPAIATKPQTKKATRPNRNWRPPMLPFEPNVPGAGHSRALGFLSPRKAANLAGARQSEARNGCGAYTARVAARTLAIPAYDARFASFFLAPRRTIGKNRGFRLAKRQAGD